MSEGDVARLLLGPSPLDLSAQERRSLTRLYSRNGGYHLRILPDGTVSGGRQENEPYGEECWILMAFISDCKLPGVFIQTGRGQLLLVPAADVQLSAGFCKVIPHFTLKATTTAQNGAAKVPVTV